MKLKARQGDLILGIFSIVVGIVILILSKVQGLEMVKSGRMGPGFFPAICGIAITLCGVMVLQELRGKIKREKKSGTANEELEANICNTSELRNLLMFVLLGSAVLLLSEHIGLLTCLGLCVIIYLKVQGKEPWLKSILIGAGMVVFLYLVFVMFLHVPVPKGPLGF